MLILAFDTSAGACSAALWRDGAAIAAACEPMTRGHAEALMPMIQHTLAGAGVGYGDLDAIAVTVGPGAFTGIRIGLAAARGMALAGSRPVVGVTTLEALARAVPAVERSGRCILAAIDTKRTDLYAQWFDAALAPLGDPEVAAPEDLATEPPAEPVIVVGDGAALAVAALTAVDRHAVIAGVPSWPQAEHIAAIAAERLAAGGDLGAGPPPVPLYLRLPAAKRPEAGGRLRP